jgi:hypothetical protein
MALSVRPLTTPLVKIAALTSVRAKENHNKKASPPQKIHRTAFLNPKPISKNEFYYAFQEINLADSMYLARLRSRDAEVRAHEQAHMSAVDGYARGGPHYIYILGPDGRLYAVGGSIDVDLSPIPNNPEATIHKARIIRRAALAVMDPSPADLRIAARAYQMEMEAQKELAREKREEQEQTAAEKRAPVELYA